MSIRIIRRTALWIAIPSVSSFVAGVLFGSHGITNFGITILAVIVGICAVEAGVEQTPGTGIGVVAWILNVFTGMLLSTIAKGVFGDMDTWKYILCLIGFAALLFLNIAYVKEIWKDVKKR